MYEQRESESEFFIDCVKFYNCFWRNSTDIGQEDSDSEKPLPSVFEPPTSTFYYIAWLLGLPVIITLYYTVPDCRKAGMWRRCYPVTFVMSAVWLAGLSYVLYWMIVIIGEQNMNIMADNIYGNLVRFKGVYTFVIYPKYKMTEL